MFSFVKKEKKPSCRLEWLYRFAFPPAVYDSSCCSTFLSALALSVLKILAILIGEWIASLKILFPQNLGSSVSVSGFPVLNLISQQILGENWIGEVRWPLTGIRQLGRGGGPWQVSEVRWTGPGRVESKFYIRKSTADNQQENPMSLNGLSYTLPWALIRSLWLNTECTKQLCHRSTHLHFLS